MVIKLEKRSIVIFLSIIYALLIYFWLKIASGFWCPLGYLTIIFFLFHAKREKGRKLCKLSFLATVVRRYFKNAISSLTNSYIKRIIFFNNRRDQKWLDMFILQTIKKHFIQKNYYYNGEKFSSGQISVTYPNEIFTTEISRIKNPLCEENVT